MASVSMLHLDTPRDRLYRTRWTSAAFQIQSTHAYAHCRHVGSIHHLESQPSYDPIMQQPCELLPDHTPLNRQVHHVVAQLIEYQWSRMSACNPAQLLLYINIP